MNPTRRLPVISETTSPGAGAIGRDGRRRAPYPADVTGRFVRARRVAYAALIAIWIALPWIPIGGHPAVFLDVDRRQFFLFGLTFNAQDVWLLFFALTGVGFLLVYATAVLGRVWCGWACPQTVFLEAVFRPIERLVNGPRATALRRKSLPTSFDSVWRTVVTHVAYVIAAALVAHVFLAYFVSLPRVFGMVRSAPRAHPEAFAWMLAVTALFYGNFAFFREQLCVLVCPYGRLQSVLVDDDSLVVGYDVGRGEPRGKAGVAKGDCVDCKRCVVVCPTGIDIREGLQLDCIACTACIDACDAIMTKLGRPTGLVRYDSLRGLRGEARKIFRPRLVVYTALLLLGALVATVAFAHRTSFEANVVRLPGPPYTRDDGTLRNAFELHVVNKSSKPETFTIEPASGTTIDFVVPITTLELAPLADRRVPFFMTMPQSRFTADQPFLLRVRMGSEVREARGVFLGARP